MNEDTRARGASGFTLVELVVVILIVGILGAVALPRFFDNRTFVERGYYEELVAALKGAQKAAVATGCPVRFTLDAAGYDARLQQPSGGRCDPGDTSWSVAVTLPDGSTLAGTAPTGVVAAPSTVVIFNALGGTNLAANRTITVGPHALDLHAGSGYVDTP